MTSVPIRPWLSAETESRTYVLPLGADVAVRVGETIGAGEIIATLPPRLRIIALADSLRLSSHAATEAIQSLESTIVRAGDTIGRHRSGLRTHTLRTPYPGEVRGVPDYGAVAILPSDGQHPIRADRPGIVAAIEPEHITITSRVLRCRIAFANGSAGAFGQIAIAPQQRDRGAIEQGGENGRASAITLVPYFATTAELTAALRSAPGPIIVGAVSETVAWEMLTTPVTEGEHAAQLAVVLRGPGDSADGAQAIAPLRIFDRTMIDLAPQCGELTIFDASMAEERGAEAAFDTGTTRGFYVDPARWHASCSIDGVAELGLLDAGIRTMLVYAKSTKDAAAWVPAVNIAKCLDS